MLVLLINRDKNHTKWKFDECIIEFIKGEPIFNQ